MGDTHKQYMIFGLPSCGSDWLCPILAKHGHGRLSYYEKEYFNPLCNWRHADLLSQGFGCEMVSCYRNITSGGVPGWDRFLDELYAETWAKESYNFDKELMSPFKLDWFATRFEIVLLYRSAASTFPPGRTRVLSWYDAIYNALGVPRSCELEQTPPLMDRAKMAHHLCWDSMMDRAKALGLKIVDYETLCTSPLDGVMEELHVGWIPDQVDVVGAAQEILATRRHVVKHAA